MIDARSKWFGKQASDSGRGNGWLEPVRVLRIMCWYRHFRPKADLWPRLVTRSQRPRAVVEDALKLMFNSIRSITRQRALEL